RIAFSADGLRVVHSREVSLRCDGHDELTLSLTRCEFVDGPVGVVLATDGAGPDGVAHDVALRGCRFDRVQSGLVRRGKDGATTTNQTRAAKNPIVVDRCRFEHGSFGVVFESPTGDAPLVVRDSWFGELETAGIALA